MLKKSIILILSVFYAQVTYTARVEDQPKYNKATEKLIKGLENYDIKLMREAILEGADVNVKTKLHRRRMYPLFFAIDQENPDFVEFLINHRADIEVVDALKQTPLHIIAKEKSGTIFAVPMAKLLIDAGACLDVKDNVGATPLDVARACETFEKIESHERELLNGMLKHNDKETVLTPAQIELIAYSLKMARNPELIELLKSAQNSAPFIKKNI